MPSFFDERILTTLQALADSNDNLITLINQFVDITQVRNIPSSQLPGHYTLQEEMNLNGQVQSLRFKSFSREDYVCLKKFNKHSRNPNSRLWSHYIVMVEIEIQDSERQILDHQSGSFFRNAAVPIIYDHSNFDRYGCVHLADMKLLKKTEMLMMFRSFHNKQ